MFIDLLPYPLRSPLAKLAAAFGIHTEAVDWYVLVADPKKLEERASKAPEISFATVPDPRRKH
jgi:hypothetical protein